MGQRMMKFFSSSTWMMVIRIICTSNKTSLLAVIVSGDSGYVDDAEWLWQHSVTQFSVTGLYHVGTSLRRIASSGPWNGDKCHILLLLLSYVFGNSPWVVRKKNESWGSADWVSLALFMCEFWQILKIFMQCYWHAFLCKLFVNSGKLCFADSHQRVCFTRFSSLSSLGSALQQSVFGDCSVLDWHWPAFHWWCGVLQPHLKILCRGSSCTTRCWGVRCS